MRFKMVLAGISTFAFVALLGLTGCASSNSASIPAPEAYQPASQPVIESAANWQQIASEVWDQVNTTLASGGYHESEISLEGPADQTAFTKALNGFLLTEAVSHGVNVLPHSAFTLTYNVQVVHYEPLTDETGAVVSTTDNDGWSNASTTNELILSISVTDSQAVRIRQSKVFYIDDADIGLYEQTKNDAETKISNSPLVSSNWYSANPHDVEPIAKADANTFALMVDTKHGPIHSVSEAGPIAAAHCAKVGMDEAKFVSESYPTNDRKQIKLQYECL